MMFQSYALFPHMTVEQNVGYGLRRLKLEESVRVETHRGGARHGAARAARASASRISSPAANGSAWRSRARSSAGPKVLLLDEPLSALDKKLREQTQFELMDMQYQVGITFVFVTHDQDEAMALATRIAVMNRGQVVQVGTPSEIYEFPQNRFVADFIGTTNLFEGTVDGVRSRARRGAERGDGMRSRRRRCRALQPRATRLGLPAARENSPEQATGRARSDQPDQGHGVGARLPRQPLDLSDQDGERQDRDRIRAERSPHLGVVDRLERRGVLELDGRLRGGAAPVRGLTAAATLALTLLWSAAALAGKTQTVVLIVSDGLRWQEIFTGAEADLLNDKAGGSWMSDEDLRKRYWRETPAARRAVLFPFLWGTVAKQGQIFGNRTAGSDAHVTNGKAFSYPGYNEMTTGFPNDAIDRNEFGPNPTPTVFEWLNHLEEFHGRVAVYGTWQIFDDIFNKARSGLVMQTGWTAARRDGRQPRARRCCGACTRRPHDSTRKTSTIPCCRCRSSTM